MPVYLYTQWLCCAPGARPGFRACLDSLRYAPERIVWDSRGQEYLTIVNFPAPPKLVPLTYRWSTQHILKEPVIGVAIV